MENALEYELNITEFPARSISSVWEPASINELRNVLVDANNRRAAVYPISTGHNWGLGSKLPVTNAEIIDLRNLNQILEVNEELCYARIQPGVTQKQLSDHLSKYHPELILNVTGSDAHSSIIGNIIERGSGKNGHRASDVREFKVMLPSGEELSTGFGGMSTDQLSYYRYGLGPDLTHLFTQSNYGVVIEAVINLMVRQPFNLYLTRFDEQQIGEFVDRFSKLVRTGIIGHSLELDSQNDPKIFELFEKDRPSEDTWFGWFAIYGEHELREVKSKQMFEVLKPVTDEIHEYRLEDWDDRWAAPISVRMKRYSGIPDDHSLISTAASFGVTLDENNPDIDLYKDLPGFRCVLPVIPFSKSGMDEVLFIKAYSKQRNFNPAISIINLDDYAMEVFVRVYFDREDDLAISKASRWAHDLLGELKERKVYPYRLDVENMESYLRGFEDAGSVWKSRIKMLFDPQKIIAPRRYTL